MGTRDISRGIKVVCTRVISRGIKVVTPEINR